LKNIITYDYCKGDLFENPQRYQHSQYFGKKFLKAYEISRRKMLDSLKTNKKEIKMIFSDDTQIVDLNTLKQFNSEKLFIFMLNNIDDNWSIELTKLLNNYIKKFEVKKRIYESYDKNFIANSTHYKNLRNYLLLSVLCSIQFRKTKNLKFLNSMLKLNDTICTQHGLLNNHIDQILFHFTIKEELDLIKDLCNQKKMK
jgi:hypothetical protein